MTIREVVGSLGSWEIALDDQLPEEVRTKLGPWGHLVVVRGEADLDTADSSSLLTAARYVGVCRRVGKGEDRSLSGVGMVVWLGDEEEKGEILETAVAFTNGTLTQWITAVLPDAVTVGTIHPLADTTKRLTARLQWMTPRKALDTIATAFGVEYRVNGNGTIDVGRQDQLYVSTPVSMVVRRGAGIDMDMVALGADFLTETSADDYTTRAVVVGSTEETGTFYIASANAPLVPYLDLHGNPVKRTRLISDTTVNSNTGPATAALNLNRFNRLTTSLKVTADEYEISGNFRAGDITWAYDPDTGLVNAANEVYFRGGAIHPEKIRVSEIAWSVTDDHSVFFRTHDGQWLELTRWVRWETGTNELTIGDLPKALTSPGSNPVIDRTDALPSTSVPGAPTGLTLTTDSYIDPVSGRNQAIVRASWTAPTTNTDNTVADLAHYVVRYRPQFRAPQWTTTLADLTTIDLPATIGLVYDVTVAAVGRNGKTGAFTSTVSITSAADQTAPPAPASLTVSLFRGQFRVAYSGLSNTGGAMPSDTNRVDVEMGTSASGPWSTISSLTPGAAGVAYADATVGQTRWFRATAYDHTGNASPASGSVSATMGQIANGDIASIDVGKLTAGTMSADVIMGGRIGTALTGARRELNAVGFQAWNSSNALTISLDGVDNLLTGRYRTALTGRRMELGSAGKLGELEFIAPDGKVSFVRSYTESGGLEAIQFGMDNGRNSLWNRINYNSQAFASYRANVHEFIFTVDDTGSTVNDGYFYVYELNQATASQSGRMQIGRNGKFDYWKSPGSDWSVHERAVGGSSFDRRLSVTDDGVQLQWPATGRSADFRLPTSTASSPALRLFNTSGFGGLIKFHYTTTTGELIQLRGWQDTHDIELWCSAVVQSSSETVKDEIEPFTGDGLELLRPMELATYRRKREPGVRSKRELGGIAETAPAAVQVLDEDGAVYGIDHGAWLAVLTVALQQIDAKLDRMEKGGTP